MPLLAAFNFLSAPLLTPLCCLDPPQVFRLSAAPWCVDPLDSTSALRHISSTMAPLSLGFTMVHHPSGFAVVSYHPVCTTDFRASGCASSLHPFGSTRLDSLLSSLSATPPHPAKPPSLPRSHKPVVPPQPSSSSVSSLVFVSLARSGSPPLLVPPQSVRLLDPWLLPPLVLPWALVQMALVTTWLLHLPTILLQFI